MSRRVLVLVALLVAAAPGLAPAQPIGTFRWQLQPYCNVLSLAVVQHGAVYQLHGNDDQCGVPQQASAVGLAFPNPNGTIGFGLTVVTAPSATPVHVDASISLATLGGSWRDSAGNSGSFVFTPGPGTGGPSRAVAPGGLPPASVTATQLAPGAVGTTQLAPGAVGAIQLGPGSVGAAHLAANAVSGAAVADGSLSHLDFADPPRAGFSGGDQNVTLSGSPAVIRSLSIDAPSSGRIIVNTSGYFQFGSAGNDSGRCSLTTGSVVDTNNLIFASDVGMNGSLAFLPLAGTRGFGVDAPGTVTIRLVCDSGSGLVHLNDTQLTAIFIPAVP